MFNTLKTIAAELKRANDLKEREIKNKEMYGWYIRPNPNVTSSDRYTGSSTPLTSYTATSDTYNRK